MRFYQLGVDNAEDSVLSSNRCNWIVTYYCDHNQKDKAMKIAKDAADVYSEGGLHILLDCMSESAM